MSDYIIDAKPDDRDEKPRRAWRFFEPNLQATYDLWRKEHLAKTPAQRIDAQTQAYFVQFTGEE